MKQTYLILLLPFIELLGVIIPQENISHFVTYFHLELAVICLCGYFGMKRSMFLLLSIWSIWLLVTNHWNVVQEYAQIEAGVFAALVYWVYRRPEWIPSDPPSDTIQIAFYYGDKSPFVAKIMALIGLDVTGIAIIVGNEAYIPVGKSGRIENRTREALRKWIKLDTHISIGFLDRIAGKRPLFGNQLHDLIGKEVKYAGCMKVFRNMLIQVVPDLSPLDTSSSLMSKMLANRR